MTITALPVLNRTDATFKADVDTFFGTELPQFSVEAEAARVEINANTVDALQAVIDATTQVTLAANQVTLATTQANNSATSASLAQQAALSAGSIAWVSGTTYSVGDLRYSPLDFQNYRRITSGAGMTDPSLDLVNWKIAVETGGYLLRSARTSNTILGVADKGKLIDISSGTFTQTFAAAAALKDGWFCYLKNSGTGDITLDPSGVELIDGLTSYVMYPGEVRLVQCDGLALRSVVLNTFYKTFMASGTFTKPPGYGGFEVRLWGGGGSGGAGSGASRYASGGGGGAFTYASLKAESLSESTAAIVGAGGAAVSRSGTGGTSGIVGGTTQFESVTAYGGGAGYASQAEAQVCYGGGGGGVISSGGNGGDTPSTNGLGFSVKNQGFQSLADEGGGSGGSAISVNNPSSGGGSQFGGGGGGCVMGPNGHNYYSAGGGSRFGGSGGGKLPSGSVEVTSDAGVAGSIPAGGGSGSKSVSGSVSTSGAGARGEIRIWGII